MSESHYELELTNACLDFISGDIDRGNHSDDVGSSDDAGENNEIDYLEANDPFYDDYGSPRGRPDHSLTAGPGGLSSDEPGKATYGSSNFPGEIIDWFRYINNQPSGYQWFRV